MYFFLIKMHIKLFLSEFIDLFAILKIFYLNCFIVWKLKTLSEMNITFRSILSSRNNLLHQHFAPLLLKNWTQNYFALDFYHNFFFLVVLVLIILNKFFAFLFSLCINFKFCFIHFYSLKFTFSTFFLYLILNILDSFHYVDLFYMYRG